MQADDSTTMPLEAEIDSLEPYRERISALITESDYPSSRWSLKDKLYGRELVLYGAGEASHLFVETVMAKHGLMPALVIDKRFRIGDEFHGIPACSAEHCPWPLKRRKAALMVLATGKLSVQHELMKVAREIGFVEVLPMMSVYEVHHLFSEPAELEVEGYSFFRKNRANILAAFDLMEDKQSEEVFWGVLRNHCTRNPKPLPMRAKEEHNFPDDLPISINYSRYLCCGAADKHHIAQIARQLDGIAQRVVIVDPMIKEISLPETTTDITFVPCALHECDGLARFTSSSSERGTTFGCRLLPSGESFARATRIDTIAGTLKPSFISMDIEGAEFHALRGASATIKNFKPTLAICVYHAVDHLWTIPLLIHSFNRGYRFWMRNYCSFTSETVVYASAT